MPKREEYIICAGHVENENTQRGCLVCLKRVAMSCLGGLKSIRCKQGDVAKYVLLPGDPKRVSKMAELWDESRFIADYREHVTYTGKIDGVDISACSTGAGGMSTASALEELAEVGADTFIRVGTCAALQDNIEPGDLIICAGTVRHDGTSDQYVEMSYPAFANYEVLLALIEAAEKLGVKYHVGVGYTHGAFYCGVGRPGYGGYTQSWIEKIQPDMQRARVLNFEAEAATIFTLSQLFGLRAGAIFTAIVNFAKDEFNYKQSAVNQNIAVATEAIKIIHGWDEIKKQKNKSYLSFSLLN